LVRRILPPLCAFALAATAVLPAVAEDEPSAVLPPERPYPTVLDAPVEYEGMSTCDPVARKGAVLLRQLLLDTYGETTVGITRACDQDSISEHKEGRAVDWMVDWKDSAEFAEAQAFVDWLSAPGPDGTPAANARRMGIMYMIWGDEMWRAYDPDRGWTQFQGCYSTQSPSYDTTCHRDHVHFSLTWDGAAGRTSYWDGTPVLDVPCPIAAVPGSAQRLRASHGFVPVKPVRVFDGRRKGEVGCYLQQRRWSGDDRSVPVRVVGRGAVPTTGVSGVAIRVTAYASNAPGWITAAGSPGAGGPRAVSLGMVGPSAATAIVPVSDTGRIWVATAAGHARVAVDVLGYFSSAPTAASDGRTGTWRPVAPKVAADLELPAKGSQDVHLDGVPHVGLAGVSVTLNATGGGKGKVRVSPPNSTTRADAVVLGRNTRSAHAFAASADGSITLHNTSKKSARVAVSVTGLVTPPSPDSARLAPRARDLGTVRTGPAKVRSIDVSTAVTPRAGAVLLSVTTLGAKSGGGVTVWGAGEQPATRSIDVRKKRTHTDLAVVSLDDSRLVNVAGDAPGGTATVRVVGILR
jgi:hypothetical protein